MANQGKDIIRGACFVDGATGASAFPLGYRVGFISSVVRTGPGVYTVTLSAGGLSRFENQIFLTVEGRPGNSNAQIAWVSDTVLTVSTYLVGAATDASFKLTFKRNGFPINPLLYPTGAVPVITYCAVFNGVDSTLTRTPSSFMTGLTEFSMAWVVTQRIGMGASITERDPNTTTGQSPFSASSDAGGRIQLTLSTILGSLGFQSIGAVPNDGIPHTFVWTVDAAGIARAWVDGMEVVVSIFVGASFFFVGLLSSGVGDLGLMYVGRADFGALLDTPCFDDFAAWSRALTPVEAAAYPLVIPAAGLELDLRMDNNANDSSGNGRNFVNNNVVFVPNP